jgi:hypothetical protein
MTPPKIKEIAEAKPPENMEYEARDGRLYARRVHLPENKVCVWNPKGHEVRQKDGYCYECGAFTGW